MRNDSIGETPRAWPERRPVLFAILSSLACAAGGGFVYWRHPGFVRPESIVIAGLLLTAPVIHTSRTVARARALGPAHAACARELVNGAVSVAAFMLVSFAIFIGILLDWRPH